MVVGAVEVEMNPELKTKILQGRVTKMLGDRFLENVVAEGMTRSGGLEEAVRNWCSAKERRRIRRASMRAA